MNKKGFTIIELLGVIVVMGIILTMATLSVSKILNQSREARARIEENNLRDSAISYVKGEKIILERCTPGYEVNNVADVGECRMTIKVSDLTNKNYFEDKSDSCNKDASIVIYRYVDSNSNVDEYRTFVAEGTCE